ncbi:hypothetical protein K456DRAFT_27859 [Colletotrichum gloeosporioides 23]|nr:hypothetical protein K456DRAFT_27859 [Colletotrichum gloeosporioides 23]
MKTKTDGIHPPFNIERVGRNLPKSTDSSTTRKTIDRWLSTCTTSHTECRSPFESGGDFKGPTRILEICNKSVVLRENVTKMRYACLSHCWGNPEDMIQTRHDTIAKFKTKIPWNELPRTFQDAVRICYQPDIQYLWIDSLCIIQNTTEDWENEAVRMADIYENAFITITATKSASPLGGCYSKTPDKYIARPIPGYKNAFARFRLPTIPTDWIKYGEQQELPLLRRGWIYQESRLSHRVLHFCAQEVIWTCRSGTPRQKQSECGEFIFASKHGLQTDNRSYRIPSERPGLLWHRMVSEYSSLQLTKTDEDRMAALAGIVKRMQAYYQMGRYLFGLWESSLILDLCWRRGDLYIQDSHRKSRYPSWSWASVHVQVTWDAAVRWDADVSDAYVLLATVVGIDVVYEGPDNLGKASKSSMCSIKIEAPILKCEVIYPLDVSGKPGVEVVLTEVEGLIASDYLQDFDMPRTRRQTGYVAVLCGRTTMTCVALHLQKRRKQDTDVYERIGLVWIEQKEDPEDATLLLSKEEMKRSWSILPEPSVIELV